MKTPNIKRIGALLCAALQITVTPYAFAECYTDSSSSASGGLPGVFGVFQNGTIDLNGRKQCLTRFFESSTLGTTAGNLITSTSAIASDRCQAYSDSAKTSTEISASGSFVGKRQLDSFIENNSNNIWPPANSQPLNGKPAELDGDLYGTVTLGSSGVLSLTKSGVVRIRKLTATGCNSNAANKSGIEFKGGSTYFIDEVSWDANCDLMVSGTGTATLNILGTSSSNLKADGKSLKDGVTVGTGFKINAGKTCFNYGQKGTNNCSSVLNNGFENKSPSAQYQLMEKQEPSLLQINVYHGTLEIDGGAAIAAGLYVDDGNIKWNDGTPSVLVGQAVAKSVTTQNNSGSAFFSKASAMNKDYTTPAVNLSKYSDYSLAAAAVSAEVKVTDKSTDGKVFLAIQRDGTTDTQGNNVAGLAGDLVVYGLNNDGSYNKTGAVYASSKTAKWADKYAKIYTDKASNLSLIGNEKSTLDTYVQGLAANAIFARPWRTAPALVDSTGSAAFFATDDGVLYSVKADGTLNWGWMPSNIATVLKSKLLNANATAISKVVADFHPWGQLRTIKDGNTLYITGTALGGGLHFALKTSSDGSAVPSIGFLDYRDGKTSPGGEAYTSTSTADTWLPLFLKTSTRTSWPFGGDAPVASATGVFDGKVAYIVDKKLVVRKIDDTGSVSGNGSINASSNLLYWGPGVLFVGSASGELLQLDESGSSTQIKADKGSWSTLSSPVLGIQGAITNGGGKLLLAQTWTGVYAATWDSMGWKQPWYTKAGGSSSSTDPTVPPLPDGAMLTTLPAIAPFDGSIKNNLTGSVLIAYTAGSVASKTTCSNGDISAWTFGPLLGNTGTQTAAKMGAVGSEQKTDRALAVRTGPGEATGLSIIIFKVNGESYVGMENTASGMGETHADKAVQQGTAPDLSKIPDGGASGDVTWKKTTPPAARLNWRELTNFY